MEIVLIYRRALRINCSHTTVSVAKGWEDETIPLYCRLLTDDLGNAGRYVLDDLGPPTLLLSIQSLALEAP